MTDRQLERSLRAWYGTSAAVEYGPPTLRERVLGIPETQPTRGWLDGLVGELFEWRPAWSVIGLALLLLALMVGLAVAIGSGILRPPRLPPAVGPAGNGLIAYESGGNLFLVDPLTGAQRTLLSGPERDFRPTWSADGTRVAFLAWIESGWVYFTMRASGGDVVQVTPEGMNLNSTKPVAWSPDGTRLLIDTMTVPYVAQADGSGVHRLSPPELPADRAVWSPDSRTVLFRGGIEGSYGMYLVNVDGTGLRSIRGGTGGPEDYRFISWSPDGTRIAYTELSAASDRLTVHVMNVDGSMDRVLAGGAFDAAGPAWSPDGSRLLYAVGRRPRVTDAPVVGTWRWWIVADYGSRVPFPVSPEFAITPVFPDLLDYVPDAFWSPDGTKVLTTVSDSEGTDHLYLLDASGGTPTELPWSGSVEPGAWQRVAP